MISFTPYPVKDRPVYGVPLAVSRRAPSSLADPGPYVPFLFDGDQLK